MLLHLLKLDVFLNYGLRTIICNRLFCQEILRLKLVAHRYLHLLIQTTQLTEAMTDTKICGLKYLMILGQRWFMVCGAVVISVKNFLEIYL